MGFDLQEMAIGQVTGAEAADVLNQYLATNGLRKAHEFSAPPAGHTDQVQPASQGQAPAQPE